MSLSDKMREVRVHPTGRHVHANQATEVLVHPSCVYIHHKRRMCSFGASHVLFLRDEAQVLEAEPARAGAEELLQDVEHG